MSRFVQDVEVVGRQIAEEIAHLKRLAAAIPQLIDRRQRQFDKLGEVARSMQQEDQDIAELVARYTDARPAMGSVQAGGGRRRGGRTLPMDIIAILHAAGPSGASLDDLHAGLSQSRQISRQNLSSTLSRMKSLGKIGKANGMFVAID
jgi:hypothetical protein